jgi:hypothetical protein
MDNIEKLLLNRFDMSQWETGFCPADNSPLYDHYARPINKDLSGQWNIYIPPIASVSLSSRKASLSFI